MNFTRTIGLALASNPYGSFCIFKQEGFPMENCLKNFDISITVLYN